MTQKQQATTDFVQLPLMANVAIYSKVATRDKVSTQDRQTQEERLTQFAEQLGYDAEQVSLFTDEGSAAAKPLLERPGYTALLQAISAGEIAVLFVSDVSRLLDDATQQQISIFISRCIEQGVFVVTPQVIYDFSSLGSVHQFRVSCMKAFELLAEATKQMQATK